jgi:Cu/Ag efflux protein CusF
MWAACAVAVALTWAAPAAGDPGWATAQAGGSASGQTDGEVRKVDKDTGKVTLKHGEIRNLDMPPMTMVFVVKDKAMLDTLKPGDKVRFKAVDASGQLIITEIEAVK